MINFIVRLLAPHSEEFFFMCVGKYTTAWTQLEASLDILISILHLESIANNDFDHPRALKRKLKLLRQYANNTQNASPYKDRILKITDDILKASDTRHDITHGFVINNAPKNYKQNFDTVRFMNNASDTKTRTFTSKDILQEAKDNYDRSLYVSTLNLELLDSMKDMSFLANSSYNSSESSHS